jgi:hypothetical protein
MTADTLEKDTLHQTSLAVWDIPTPAGRRAVFHQGRREIVDRLRARRPAD